MRKIIVIASLLLSALASAQTYTWEICKMDGHRTGARAIGGNVSEAIGTVDGNSYLAPSGTVFRGGTVPKVVEIVTQAQDRMAPVKHVVGYSSTYMERVSPECALYDMIADWFLESVEKLSGKKTDLSILNKGGFRIDMPKGDITVDDIKSMFPFKNSAVHVTLSGKNLREIFEDMVSEKKLQVIGGVRIIVEGDTIISIEVGGAPLDDEKVYGLATIDFLLNGGDHIYLAKDALEVTKFPVYFGDLILDKVKTLTSEGKVIEYQMDNRIVKR